MKALELREQCHDCGAHIGECHVPGCDIERCPFCGEQMLQDKCQYDFFGILTDDTMEHEWKSVYEHGLTPEMSEIYEAHVKPHLIPWDGTWPGVRECREYGFWTRWTDHGWAPCDADHPQATEDLNRLYEETKWDEQQKRRVLR